MLRIRESLRSLSPSVLLVIGGATMAPAQTRYAAG
jgi:hypothetical protein